MRSVTQRARARAATMAAGGLSAALVLTGCGHGSHKASAQATKQPTATASASATSPTAAPGPAGAQPPVTLADAHRLIATWLTTYNSTYQAMNKAGNGEQALQRKVMWAGAAAQQEAALAEAHLHATHDGHGLGPIRLSGTPQYWVPRSVASQNAPWIVVKATPAGRSLPTYYVFAVWKGSALLVEDPPAHPGVKQPEPVLDKDGYVTEAPDAPGDVISQRYTAFWNADANPPRGSGKPRLAPDNWSVTAYPRVNKNLRGTIRKHEGPVGMRTADGGSLYFLALYNDPSQPVTNVISVGVTLDRTGGTVEEPAGQWAT